MKTTCWRTTVSVAIFGLFFSATGAQAAAASATATQELGPITTLGCYSDPGQLVKANTNTFQTSGLCQPVCGNGGHAVMAIIGGSTCYCGDILPPLDKEVDESKCNSPCQGYDAQTCGGIGFYQVYLTGLTGDVQTMPNSTSSSSSGSHPSTKPAQTVVVTASASSDSNSSGGPNKVGIAVGVVVGVIAIAALAGGAIFYMKQKRKREIEEEHKAQAAVNSFIGSRHSDTKSDMRLDPSVSSSFRRDSVGSIRDEVDYTRKILQVRNPDRGSINSVA